MPRQYMKHRSCSFLASLLAGQSLSLEVLLGQADHGGWSSRPHLFEMEVQKHAMMHSVHVRMNLSTS